MTQRNQLMLYCQEEWKKWGEEEGLGKGNWGQQKWIIETLFFFASSKGTANRTIVIKHSCIFLKICLRLFFAYRF